jgi:hypothetical protein
MGISPTIVSAKTCSNCLLQLNDNGNLSEYCISKNMQQLSSPVDLLI